MNAFSARDISALYELARIYTLTLLFAWPLFYPLNPTPPVQGYKPGPRPG